jgi:hypothetical protein
MRSDFNRGFELLFRFRVLILAIPRHILMYVFALCKVFVFDLDLDFKPFVWSREPEHPSVTCGVMLSPSLLVVTSVVR